jgi:phage tail sheath gpL-like
MAKADTPLLKPSLVRAFAQKVIKEKRGGSITRITNEFYVAVNTDLDVKLRALGVGETPATVATEGAVFTTGTAKKKAGSILDEVVAKIIEDRVMAVPEGNKSL